MEMTDLTKVAYSLSKKYHATQTDKGGRDYFNGHILSVFNLVGGNSSSPPELGIVALLHDIVEDTEMKIEQIRKLFGDVVAGAVQLLTHLGNSKKIDMLYLSKIKENPLAKKVKIADLTHNSDVSRLPKILPADEIRLEKYKESLEYLNSESADT